MTDDSFIHVGRYYVGVTVYEIVEWYKGEDSGARYPVFGNYEIAENCDLHPVLDLIMPSGKTIKTFLDDIVRHWPPYAGKHYSPVSYSFYEYAKSLPGVIISNYGKNYGIINYLPEEYDYIIYLYNRFYAVKKGDYYAMYKAGDTLNPEDFKYQSIRQLWNHLIEIVYDDKREIISLENHKIELLFDLHFETISSPKVEKETFYLLWPNLNMQETYVVIIDGKTGLINSRKGWVISNKYDSILFLKNRQYIAASVGGKYGLIDIDEHLIYQYKYDSIKVLDFDIIGLWDSCTNDNTFYYIENGLYGLFNIKKGEIIEAKYNSIKLSSDNRLNVTINSKSGIIDTNGNVIIPCDFDEIEVDGDSYVLVNHINKSRGSYDKLYGAATHNGKVILSCEYNRIKKYGHIFIVEKEGLNGCFDLNGRVIIDCKYKYLEPACEWFIASVASDIYKTTVYGIIDGEGKPIIPYFYTRIEHLHSSSFRLTVQSKSITINIGSELPYSDTKPLCKNLLKRKLIVWGIVDTEGNEITPCIYSDILYDENLDVFRVSTSTQTGANYKKWGLLDANGNQLCPPIFNKISTFKNGVATVYTHSGKGTLTGNGKIVNEGKKL